MNITIQIQDGAVTTSQSVSGERVTSSPSGGQQNDGGAPKQSLGGDDAASSGGDTTDIGGPPQWLTEAIGKEGSGQGEGNTAAAFRDSGSAEGQDGGSGPSF